ncbi:MAG: hypothetical protein LH614_00085 [Pyrinomonadaceae bacterium]|nr:hypothetical protein [Pyrinomonadaceae bacterium]
MELQLIQLYLWVCLVCDKHPMLKYQRLSNNWQPDFTDQELITIYLFGHFQGHFNQKRIYGYISHHFLDWFPDLPSYQAFNRRLNELAEPLKIMVFELMAKFAQDNEFFAEQDCVIDSVPIMWRCARVPPKPKLPPLRLIAAIVPAKIFFITGSKYTF